MMMIIEESGEGLGEERLGEARTMVALAGVEGDSSGAGDGSGSRRSLQLRRGCAGLLRRGGKRGRGLGI